ncbi:MAG TPA: sodium:proton antiporter [Bacillota bacterium]|nr:sodium:proton antiporter [Bacillota bacterium]
METSNVIQVVEHELWMLTTVFIFGIVAMKISEKFRIPDVALFMIVGMLIGPSGLHLVLEPGDSLSNQFIIMLGSILILFDGGRGIDVSILKKVWVTITLLAVPGVIVTAVVVGVAAHYVFHIPLLYAFLIASIIASTDPATLIPVFKQVKIKESVRQTVESESAFNDATGSILTFTVLGMIMSHSEFSLGSGVREFVVQAGGGLLVGALIGAIGLLLKSKHPLGFFQSHAQLVGALMAIGSYLFASSIGASGFMATFTAGVFSGNPKIFKLEIHEKATEHLQYFGETFSLIMRTLIFMLLGTQVNFTVLMKYGWKGLLLILIFMFIARPLTVLICALPDRLAKWSWKDILFMFWVRETGVIPAALSGMIVATGIQYGDIISSVTFLAILITILVQASTTGFVAKKLGLVLQEKNH